MSEALERMNKARIALIIKQPFFGALSHRLELAEDATCKTSWTDGRKLGFNPSAVIDRPLDELEYIWAHHILTCALGHPYRRGGREAKAWNEASDQAVNAELATSGFHAPSDCTFDSQFKGMYTEAIYTTLLQSQQEDCPVCEGDSTKTLDQPCQACGDTGKVDGKGQLGDCSTGEVRDATSGADGVDEQQLASPAELEEQAANWQTAVAQALQSSKGFGRDPGTLERALQVVLDPKVDWREALQRLIKSKSKDDFNWSRPSRRMIPYGLYLPSADSVQCGPLAFAIDVSASIGRKAVSEFLSEAEAARQEMHPSKVIIMFFDTAIKTSYEFDGNEPIGDLMVQGGGGTSFVPPVKWLEAGEVTPEVLVYLTDLDSGSFPDEPEYPVVWVTTRLTKAPFGDVIPM